MENYDNSDLALYPEDTTKEVKQWRKDPNKGKGFSFLILFICCLFLSYNYWDIKVTAEEIIELDRIEKNVMKKFIKRKAAEFKKLKKENGKMKVALIKMNSWVSNCWTCKKLKENDELTTDFIIKLGLKN